MINTIFKILLKHYLNQKILYDSLVRLGLYEAALVAANNAWEQENRQPSSDEVLVHRTIDLLEAHFYLYQYDEMTKILLDGWRTGVLNDRTAQMIVQFLYPQISQEGNLREACMEIMKTAEFHQKHLLGITVAPCAAVLDSFPDKHNPQEKVSPKRAAKDIATLKAETISRLNEEFEAIRERMATVAFMAESANRICNNN